jgi:putative transposase
MIDRHHALPIKRQAALLGITRGSVYYRPEPTRPADLALMRRMDELHLEYPFAGARMLRDMLIGEGTHVGRKHVGTLMRRMGITAMVRKTNTSKPHPGHKVFPYLLRELPITRADQVWAMDLTYIPMARGFVYLTAVLDWHMRRVLAPRVSITMDGLYCVEAFKEAVLRRPVEFTQFTSSEFIGALEAKGVAISMNGRGQWRDNVFVERLWRSVKYEDGYLRAYETVSAARAGIGRSLTFYNRLRPHMAHGAWRKDAGHGVLRAVGLSIQPVAHRVGRSSHATSASVDNHNRAVHIAAEPLIQPGFVFKQLGPLPTKRPNPSFNPCISSEQP